MPYAPRSLGVGPASEPACPQSPVPSAPGRTQPVPARLGSSRRGSPRLVPARSGSFREAYGQGGVRLLLGEGPQSAQRAVLGDPDRAG